MRIFIVRHGQTKWNLEKRAQGSRRVPINSEGKKQAEKLAQKFKKINLTAIYSSPALRTKQTAKIIAKEHKIKVVFDVLWIECIQGNLAGLTGDQMKKMIPNLEQQWAKDGIDWRPPGDGETIRELQNRTISAFNKLINKHNIDDVVLVVTHGGTIKSLVHYLHGGKPEDFFHAQAFENAEVVEIDFDGKQCKILDKSL